MAALGAFVPMGIYFVEVVEDPAFHLRCFIEDSRAHIYEKLHVGGRLELVLYAQQKRLL